MDFSLTEGQRMMPKRPVPARGTNSRHGRAWMRGQKKPPYNGVPAENRGIARNQPQGEPWVFG